MPSQRKPEAIPASYKCSVCGIDWKRHGEKPTLETCIDLLKAKQWGAMETTSGMVHPKWTTVPSKGKGYFA